MAETVSAPVAETEPSDCADCVRDGGLCRRHEVYVLPQWAVPSWPKMIGDPYVCLDPDHDEHRACLDVPGHSAPRAACGCHHCSQRRWANLRNRETRLEIGQPASADIARETRRAMKRAPTRKAKRLATLERSLTAAPHPVRVRNMATVADLDAEFDALMDARRVA